jgi:membrane associated rhomboid family serine protease
VIPIRDTVPSRRFPIINYTLMALCAWGFLIELGAGAQLEELLRVYALVPARYFALVERLGPFTPELYVPFFTSMFLHAGWAHFLGNMLYLWIFGDNVEDRMGRAGYLVFYLTAGMFGGISHLMTNPDSVVPTIGASGAIAGVMGAYFLLYPRSRVMTMFVFFFWVEIVPIPAVLYLLFWFVMQLASGTLALAASGPTQGGVAWWAHAGGFAYGSVVVLVLALRRPSRRGLG